ncbi:MAG: DMT family transporter [Roseicyclus sp.]|nr:DMT family transporter [Roseicyclus sp.]
MISLSLGLFAAFFWAVHDLCVRKVSASVGVFSSLIAVLVLGTLVITPFAVGFGNFADAPLLAYRYAITAGVFYAIAGLGLYKALSIGPVRLAAPIIGAYPILSMTWAATSGGAVEPLHWLAVIVVIAGVGYIAITSDAGASDGSKGWAIFWSMMSGPGFAIAFALSQEATALADEWAMMLPMRGTAIVAILGIALVMRAPILPRWGAVWILAIMGSLDALALGAVSGAGNFANPEFAAVAASTFGLITVVLAAIFLHEQMRGAQWIAVVVVFAAIGTLGL